MNLENASEADLNGALAAVMSAHDPKAAKNLVEYFYVRIRAGEPYNERILLEYIDHAFGRIVNEGVSADHAFGFKKKRGKHKREDTTERDVVAAAIVTLRMRNGMTWLDAKGAAANELFPDGKGEKAVEAAYSQYKVALSYMSSDALTELIG